MGREICCETIALRAAWACRSASCGESLDRDEFPRKPTVSTPWPGRRPSRHRRSAQTIRSPGGPTSRFARRQFPKPPAVWQISPLERSSGKTRSGPAQPQFAPFRPSPFRAVRSVIGTAQLRCPGRRALSGRRWLEFSGENPGRKRVFAICENAGHRQ